MMGGGRRKMNPAAMGPMKKPDKKTISRLLKYLKPYTGRLILVLLCLAASAVASAANSFFLGNILINNIIQNSDLDMLAVAVLVMAGIYLLGVIAAFFQTRIMAVVSQGVLKTIRDDMFTHMQTLPIRYFDSHTYGDVMSHYTNDTDTLRQMISQSIPQLLSSVITIVVMFIFMLITSPAMTLIVIGCIVLMTLLVGKLGGKSAKYFIGQQTSLGKINGYIEEMINGQKVVKLFCHEKESKEGFDKLNEELTENATTANRFAGIIMPIMGNLGHLEYAVVAILGGSLAIAISGTELSGILKIFLCGTSASFTLGSIVAFLGYSKSFYMPISQVSQQFNSVIMALAGAKRIFGLMDEKSEVDNGYVTLINAKKDGGKIVETDEHTGFYVWKHPHSDGTVTYTPLQGDVVLNEVDFGYVPEKTVLHDVSIYARPGQKVAFVGATGAGKTTITNLLNRFYDIADGKIRYDGININKIEKSSLRRSLGIVLQDVNLFTGTVMENIRYGNLEATDEECIAAAKRAGAHSFIEMLPEGYNTVLSGDGSGLSQGQRQLLSIARAAVADPPVMILDEATSSIDTRTEAIVAKGMDALMQGRTVFVIAHRLSTIRNSDVIMVLDQGRIIERGNHEELIKQKGKYYQLYTGAFELD